MKPRNLYSCFVHYVDKARHLRRIKSTLTGNLTHCRQTLQLVKFYLIKNMKGIRRNLAITIQVSLFKYSVKFFLLYGEVYSFLSFHCLLFICLLAFLTAITTVANKCKEHIKCVQS